jgi:D-glycero-D-manno-heptose 1,7-bisphosphate phosphatase
MNRAIFLDRDGTIIRDNGYINIKSDVKFYNYTFDCLQKLQKEFLLFIVTNQSGISKGLVTKNEVEAINLYILQIMKRKGIRIKELYCCPHDTADDCECRKPKPFFIYKAKNKYSIDLSNSFVIGDHFADIKLALNVGAKGVYLLTGHGQRHYHELTEEIKNKIKIHRNLFFATNEILKGKY